MRRLLITLISAALVDAAPLHAQQLAEWREDLRVLATELPARHKNAFAHVSRAQWDSAVRVLDAKLPRLQRHEVVVELMRLVALVRDGHTALDLGEHVGFHRLPIQLYDFKDGLFVVAADSAHADLAGAKVVRIGSSSPEDAMHAVGELVSHESPNWARARAPALLVVPEILAALGMARDVRTAQLTLEQNGRRRVVTLTGTGSLAGGHDQSIAGQVEMSRATPGADPLYLQHPGEPFWFTILRDSTLYIGYRAVVFFANGMLNEQFFRRAFAAGDSTGAVRVVLDLRDNGGGNNFLNRFVVKEIIRRPRLDRDDRCLVIIGRRVFSAAQNLVNELDYYTNATFVGEPTGNSPNQYGDARPLELPRSHLRVMVSSLLWQSHSASDEREWFPPDVYVEATSSDYAAKRDPVLEAALKHATGPTLADLLSRPAARADTIELRRLVDAYRTDPQNRYRDIEADINVAGYRLLRGADVEGAIAVFRINVALFPRSGNVYDSLGEALERANRKDQAIAAYRRALSLNPNLGSSRDALRRLGSTP